MDTRLWTCAMCDSSLIVEARARKKSKFLQRRRGDSNLLVTRACTRSPINRLVIYRLVDYIPFTCLYLVPTYLEFYTLRAFAYAS